MARRFLYYCFFISLVCCSFFACASHYYFSGEENNLSIDKSNKIDVAVGDGISTDNVSTDTSLEMLNKK